jgi:hypothetical protein
MLIDASWILSASCFDQARRDTYNSYLPTKVVLDLTVLDGIWRFLLDDLGEFCEVISDNENNYGIGHARLIPMLAAQGLDYDGLLEEAIE